MVSLETLNFRSNLLTGILPVELSTITSMVNINLYSNSLSGTIPVGLSTMTSIDALQLYSNSLTGTVPAELSAMTSLGSLQVYDNSLTGLVPSFLCNAAPSTCDLIDSGTNEFWCTSICDNGNYPCDLTSSNCETPTTLDDKLTDTYGSCYDPAGPSCSCSGTLDLSSQSLTGTIPSALSACTGLTSL
jgi:hypothetical protein